MSSSQIRNYLERCLIPGTADAAPEGAPPPEEGHVDPMATYATERERERASADFERRYLKALLYLHDGKVGRAAAAAWIDRAYFHRVLRRHGIVP